jgi:hypothetical protein
VATGSAPAALAAPPTVISGTARRGDPTLVTAAPIDRYHSHITTTLPHHPSTETFPPVDETSTLHHWDVSSQ